MPVVDNENRLVGIITIDDVVDIIEQENTEDIHKMAAIQPTEEEYLKTSIFKLARHRVPWLLILMFSATLRQYHKRFENVLQSVVILAAFIPMLMDTAGNAGAQSSALVIRGLALGEIRPKDFLKVLWKEIRVSLIAGLTLATANYFRLLLFERVNPLIAFVVCLALFLTVIFAKVIGCLLPIAAKGIRLDPAIMASPLITTIVDAFALVIYFAMATWLMGL